MCQTLADTVANECSLVRHGFIIHLSVNDAGSSHDPCQVPDETSAVRIGVVRSNVRYR